MAKKKKDEYDVNQFLAEVEKRAYERYEERKKNHISGDDFHDWLDAENDIKQKYGIKKD